MAVTGFSGIDVRQSGDRLIFDTFLQAADGTLLTTGTTVIRIFQVENDGTLKSYDFNDNTFKTTALTTATSACTHCTGNNGTYNTGLWSCTLTTLTGFTRGANYRVTTNNTGAFPTDQMRAFVFGGAEGDLSVDTSGGVSVGSIVAAALAQFFSVNSTKVYADAVAGSVVKEIASNAGGGTPPTAAAIADAVWDEATAGHVGAGSFGLNLDAQVTTRTKPSDTQAAVTLVATTTNLTNAATAGDLTAAMKASVNVEADTALSDVGATGTRMGYLDKLNISGNVAASSEVTAIQNNTRAVRVVPDVIERPDTGSVAYRIELLLYDDIGNMEAPDAAPTISAVNQGGTSRDANLDSTTMALVSTGRYRSTYTVDATHELEQLVVAFSVVEGGATRIFANPALVVDTTAVDFTAADRTKLDTLHDTRIPGVIQPQTGDSYARIGVAGAGLTDLATQATLLTVAGYIDTEVASILAAVDTEVAAIKAKTDNLPTDPADESSIQAAIAAIPSAPTVVAIRTEMDSNSVKLKRMGAKLCGLTEGAGTDTEKFYKDGEAIDPGTLVETDTVTAVGERTAIVFS